MPRYSAPDLCWNVSVAPHFFQSSLVKALVEKAACSGWGKVYFTGSTFDENPWDENTLFWDDLVTEVSQDIDITCPDSAESQMRIMVPFLPDPVPSASGAHWFVCIYSDFARVYCLNELHADCFSPFGGLTFLLWRSSEVVYTRKEIRRGARNEISDKSKK